MQYIARTDTATLEILPPLILPRMLPLLRLPLDAQPLPLRPRDLPDIAHGTPRARVRQPLGDIELQSHFCKSSSQAKPSTGQLFFFGGVVPETSRVTSHTARHAPDERTTKVCGFGEQSDPHRSWQSCTLRNSDCPLPPRARSLTRMPGVDSTTSASPISF